MAEPDVPERSAPALSSPVPLAPRPPAVCVEKLCVARGGARILHEVDLTARFGEVLAILGPNGAGKSTLLRAVAGLTPYTGVISLDGTDLANLSLRERARMLAYVPQTSALASALPVRDVVGQGRYVHRRATWSRGARDAEAIDCALTTTDTVHLAARAFTALSCGEQRRVLIARALAGGGRILCLDEPTASLDVRHALDLYALARELAAGGLAVLMVLHSLDDALRHADRALLLAAGRRVCEGPADLVIDTEVVCNVYAVGLERTAGLRFHRDVPPERSA